MKYRQRGMGLVELLVAMTIGLFLIGAIAGLYVATANGARGSMLEAQMNEDASLALEILQQQLQLAGYSGLKNDPEERNFQGIGIRGCDGGFETNATQADFNELNACATNRAGADALAIRYEATLLNTQPTWDDTLKVYRPTNCSFMAIAAWPGAGSTPLTLADNRYYVANDSSNDSTPTLFCKGKNGSVTDNGFQAATALVPNIEDMQIVYAVSEHDIYDGVRWNHMAMGTGGRGEQLLYAVRSPLHQSAAPNRIPGQSDYVWETGPDAINNKNVTIGYMTRHRGWTLPLARSEKYKGERSLDQIRNVGKAVLIATTVITAPSKTDEESCSAAALPLNFLYTLNALNGTSTRMIAFKSEGKTAYASVVLMGAGGYSRGMAVVRTTPLVTSSDRRYRGVDTLNGEGRAGGGGACRPENWEPDGTEGRGPPLGASCPGWTRAQYQLSHPPAN